MNKYDFWDELGRIFNAVVAYQEKTVEFNDQFITPWIKLGNVFDKQDRNKEAVSAYQNAIAIDPSNAKNWFELGDVYFQMNDFENAADAYKRSTELAPDSAWAYNNLALTLVNQGKYEESIPLYQKGIEMLQVDKDKAVAWNRLGNAYRKLNNYEQAMNAFTKADNLDSENAGFRDVLDDVSSGPSIVSEDSIEGQDGDAIPQTVLENIQELDAISEPLSGEPELTAESQNGDEEIVSEESAVMEVDPESEPALEAVSQATAESETEVIPESELDLDLVNEGVEAISQDALEAEAVEQIEDDVQVAISESISEAEQDFSGEINVEGVDQPEAVVSSDQSETARPRSILEIVEAVIAKVLAESENEAEAPADIEPALEAIAEQPVMTEEVETEVDSPALAVEEHEESDQAVIAEAMNVVADPAPEVEMETIDQPVDVAESVSLEVLSEALDDETVQDDALQLIAQNTSETFTDTLFVASPETDTADASLLVAESNDEVNSEIEAEEALLELPVAGQDTLTDTQAAPANVAYEEYLNDNNGQFKIFVNEHAKESEDVQDSFLPAELLARIDAAGDVQIEADAKNAHVWNELGNVYFNSGAYEDAVISYSKSIELDRQFAWPYSNLALVYVQKGRFAEAMLLYQRSIELFSNDKDKAISWNRLGNVYRRLNDYDNAIAAYQRADELDTDNSTLSLQSRFSLLGNYYMENKTSYAA